MDIYIFMSCEMVTDLLDRTPCISDHHWYYHLGKATIFSGHIDFVFMSNLWFDWHFNLQNGKLLASG